MQAVVACMTDVPTDSVLEAAAELLSCSCDMKLWAHTFKRSTTLRGVSRTSAASLLSEDDACRPDIDDEGGTSTCMLLRRSTWRLLRRSTCRLLRRCCASTTSAAWAQCAKSKPRTAKGAFSQQPPLAQRKCVILHVTTVALALGNLWTAETSKGLREGCKSSHSAPQMYYRT